MIEKLLAYLKDLIDNKFYGKVVLFFENGKVTHMKEEKSVKLSK